MYSFKNFKYYQLGGTKSKYYSCSVDVDIESDIIADISKLDRENLNALVRDIKDDIIDDFNKFLKQNNIKITVSVNNPMYFSIGSNYANGFSIEPKIYWETPIGKVNTANLQKLEKLLNN